MKIESIILREVRIPLVKPFETSFGSTTDRRILLAEIRADGLTGWGECTAGEHPYFSDETVDTAWAVILGELAPSLASADVAHPGKCPQIFGRVRGHRMAKAALENAVWDLQAQMDGVSLAHLLGGVRDVIPCGVSIGIQSSVEHLMAEVEKELAAGYQRIKLKCKPGWDVNVFSAVRERWPGIMLSCDANSAYRLRDTDHLLSFDEFEMLMIEQPLWADDFYFHSMLQKHWRHPSASMNLFVTVAMPWRQSTWNRAGLVNIKVGRVGGFSEAIAVHNAAHERGIPVWCGGMLKLESAGRTTSHCHRWKISVCREMSPHPDATGRKISSSPKWLFRLRERFAFLNHPGVGSK